MPTAAPPPTVEPLAPEASGAMVAFARACRAAARVTALYPAEHPSVAASLAQIVGAARRLAADRQQAMAVLPDMLTIEGRRPARPDAAIGELAALLHAHQVGRLEVHPHSDEQEWRRFLSLLALPPEQTRHRGGLPALWSSEGQTRIVVHAIDYAGLLRDRISGDRASWEAIVGGCLADEALAYDDWMLDLLLDILDRPENVGRLMQAVEERLPAGDRRGPVIVASLLHAVSQYVAQHSPDQLEPVLVAMAASTARMPLEALAPVAAVRRDVTRPELSRFVTSLAHRMTDDGLAARVADEVRAGRGTSPALGDVLDALVPDVNRRSSILALARQSLAQGGALPDAAAVVRRQVNSLLAVHDDSRFVSEAYSVELHQAGDRAIGIERDATDPPDRIRGWVDTVTDSRVRHLDAQLLVDLMQMRREAGPWRDIAALAVARVHVLIVLGDFPAAAFLVEALQLQREDHPTPAVRDAAAEALGEILSPDMMRHVASHLDTADAATPAAATRFCQAIGPASVPQLAEVLSREERARTRQHLIAILTSFGAAGRQSVERLMQSSNSAVRRTAVQLLREFGGHDALPELESLLSDEEPHVQREATRAIALLGVEPAFDMLTRALVEGSERSRSAITSVLWTLPPEDTTPLLAHIVSRAPRGGEMRGIHERAIQRLADVGDPIAVRALGEALIRGRALAPFQTAAFRRLAAAGLARVGTDEALDHLRAASIGGSWSLRRAARAALATLPAPSPR